MSTSSVTNTLVQNTLIDADKLNANFTDLVSFNNTAVAHVDGSRAFTSPVVVPDATGTSHAVNKGQLDAGPAAQDVVAWSVSPADLTTTATYVVWGSVVSVANPNRQVSATVSFSALAKNIGSSGSRVASYKLQYSTDGGSVWNNFVVGPTTNFDCDAATDFSLWVPVARTVVLSNVTPTGALQFRVAVKSNSSGNYTFTQGSLSMLVIPS